MVAIWDESVAVRVQVGVVYPAGSTIFFELSSRSSGFLLLLVHRSCLQSLFLQLHFRGSGVFTDEWAMVLAATNRVRFLLVIIFWLISENSTVLSNVTGRSYVACSVLSVCFGCGAPRLFSGFYGPSVHYNSCHIGKSSLGVKTYLLK